MSVDLFVRYAFPPNELGYCGPPDAEMLLRGGPDALRRAEGFTGAWPYLEEIAAASGLDPLHPRVTRTYWVGGPLLGAVDGDRLLARVRQAMVGQPTGLLHDLDRTSVPLAHHSFHVVAVYPWVRMLAASPCTPLRILQACRVRWGTVQSVDDERAVIMSAALQFDGGRLFLGALHPESVRWRRAETSLVSRPRPGDVVSAHWDWICDILDEHDSRDLAAATRSTLVLVNAALRQLNAVDIRS